MFNVRFWFNDGKKYADACDMSAMLLWANYDDVHHTIITSVCDASQAFNFKLQYNGIQMFRDYTVDIMLVQED